MSSNTFEENRYPKNIATLKRHLCRVSLSDDITPEIPLICIN